MCRGIAASFAGFDAAPPGLRDVADAMADAPSGVAGVYEAAGRAAQDRTQK